MGLLAALLCLIPASGSAQTRYTVTGDGNFRQEPGPAGRLLARVNQDMEVTGGEIRDGWIAVTLEGWIWERSLRANPNSELDLAVANPNGENLRDGPNGRVVARLLSGFLLQGVGPKQNGWTQVRRQGWMWGRALEPLAAPAGPPAAPAAPPTPRAAAVGLDQMTIAPKASLLARPTGDTLAAVRGATPARVLGRSDGWARVQVEAWVRESDLSASDDSVLVGVSAAEVRADRAFEGKALRWELQLIAVQTADELRRDMPNGQKYLLARGPLPETGFVYVLLTAQQAPALERVESLSYLNAIVRVRAGRSRFLGNPVVDLVDYSVK